MNVNTISVDGDSALVEWTDYEGAHRCYLPKKIVKEEMSQRELLAGIPYGIEWERFPLGVTPNRIAKILREHGIWTADDLKNNLPKVRAAMQVAYSTDIEILINGARAREDRK